jgi:hypothetical protein
MRAQAEAGRSGWVAHESPPEATSATSELRGQLKAEHLALYIQKVVDDASPSNRSQRDKLCRLFRGGDAA